MRASLNKLALVLLGGLLAFGCAPSFKKFKQVVAPGEGFIQYRVNADGNAFVPAENVQINQQLFERKLNAGISAQVIGNSRYLVVPTFNKRIYFLNPQTGEEITSLMTESAVGASAALQGELLYYAEQAGGDELVCYNIVSGKNVWKRPIADPPGAPIIEGDQVLIGSHDGKVYCLDRWTGDSVWVHTSKRALYATVSANSAIVVFGTDAGEIIALDRQSGDELWAYQSQGAIFAQALIAGLVYCGSADGRLYALRSSDGELIWEFETTAQIQTTPVFSEDRVVFGSDDKMIYCLDAQDGGVLWRHETSGIIHASPIAVGNTIVVANSAGGIYHLGLDGTILAEFNVRGSIEATPAFIDGRLFIVTTQRRIYSFGAPQSTAKVP